MLLVDPGVDIQVQPTWQGNGSEKSRFIYPHVYVEHSGLVQGEKWVGLVYVILEWSQFNDKHVMYCTGTSFMQIVRTFVITGNNPQQQRQLRSNTF